MFPYILRRLFAAVLILLGASFLVYLLMAYFGGDPLAELRASNSPTREAQMNAVKQQLQLDVPPVLRYFLWLGGAVKCVLPSACDLGANIKGQEVTGLLGSAAGNTLQFVTVAFLLAIVIGVTVGIVTALRQYSGLDYTVTFVTFLFFSLPVFWVAVLLKEFGAIGFNNFLASPTISVTTTVVLAVLMGVLWYLIIPGSWKRRLIAFVVAAVATAAILTVLVVTDWFANPGIGPVMIALCAFGLAIGFTALVAGLRNRRALIAALITAAIGVVSYFVVQPILNANGNLPTVLMLGAAAIVIALVIGWFAGGYDRAQNMRAAVLTAFVTSGLVLIDRFMQSWPAYYNSPLVHGRPVATIGSQTPNLNGDFWFTGLDKYTHLLLPTIALILISLASYTRFSRASMLEVMNQDYVRTARAKGVNERSVVVRHAFRNALIPLATVVAADLGALIGGAVITERVFSFTGMGTLFIDGILRSDPNPVMAVFIIVGITTVLFNLLADIAYSLLDPRVRLT
ncbi:ABC transporter permease [Tersicoccus phoenicis]|uniref:ABC transporter permease n=1 Tax=Tersicoccus phoenicis TaxID=554083 RepID=A0A1R1L794_9MICC|nr:ABC transporter permease [Tersicoccus phoenicis]OMH23408.1 ABC transporter permease [Tersicoccus phoenicis]